ncbi:unnamed protein product [Anisakis simplex]|uniref:Phosphomannomutase n=1 Tax=Anisakis simplex TaxID=6269 RepID=A0A0M3K6H2_ANISI|nr:unnamed protein product [Anisakis simplex]
MTDSLADYNRAKTMLARTEAIVNTFLKHGYKGNTCDFPHRLDSNSFAKILNDIDTFIFDADGVLYLGDTPIQGSSKFLDFLRQQVIQNALLQPLLIPSKLNAKLKNAHLI